MNIPRRASTVVVAAIATPTAVIAALLIGSGTQSALARASGCKPKVSSTAIRFCGPAKGTLSIFPGVTFHNGSCVVKTVNGLPNLSLKLGTRSLKNPLQTGGTNSGLPYYDFSVSGPLSSPVGGGVIAFWKGKHWYGRGVSFKGNAHEGTFVAQGIPERGSRGTATGSYRC